MTVTSTATAAARNDEPAGYTPGPTGAGAARGSLTELVRSLPAANAPMALSRPRSMEPPSLPAANEPQDRVVVAKSRGRGAVRVAFAPGVDEAAGAANLRAFVRAGRDLVTRARTVDNHLATMRTSSS